MKTLFEIFRILRELGVKTKDIIGVGKNIKQVGQTLFNADVNTRVLRLIHRTGEIGDSLKSELVNVGRTLRNLNDIEKRKFLTNLKQIKNVFKPQEAEVIDIATKAKLPASGIEKLKSTVGFPRNVHPESDIGRIMTHARKSKTFDTTKEAMKLGEARWILNKALKDDLFAFKPQEIEIIKGGKGDVLEIFKEYFGNKAANNLPAKGSINSASKFFDELKWAVDESGFFANHPKFNKEAVDFKKTRELMKEFGDTIEGHPYTTQSELRAAMKTKAVPESGYDNFKADLLLNKQGIKKDIITAEGVIEGGKINVSDHIKFIKSKNPVEAMQEANKVIKREGPYKNLTTEEAKQILKDTENYIFQRDIPPEFASGGRIPGHATGGVSNLFRRR